MKNASIHAQELVVVMHVVMLWTTIRSVAVLLVILEILSMDVKRLKVWQHLFFYSMLLLSLFCFVAPILREPENPCIPTPCGPNSQCRVIGSQAACSCLPNYVGQSPNCRPECTISAECPSNLACIYEKCSDPCPGSCGVNARCSVINHNAVCTCVIGYEGDPTIQCSSIPPPCKRMVAIAMTL